MQKSLVEKTEHPEAKEDKWQAAGGRSQGRSRYSQHCRKKKKKKRMSISQKAIAQGHFRDEDYSFKTVKSSQRVQNDECWQAAKPGRGDHLSLGKTLLSPSWRGKTACSMGTRQLGPSFQRSQ